MSFAFVVPSFLAYRFPPAHHHSAMQTATAYGTTSVINACAITVHVAAVFPLWAVLSLCPTMQTSWVGGVVIVTEVFKCVSPI